MLERLNSWLISRRQNFMSQDTEELTVLEFVGMLGAKINEVVDALNGWQDNLSSKIAEVMLSVNKKVSIIDLEQNRRLSSTGDFTGTIMGKDSLTLIGDVSNTQSLCQTLITMVNNRESIGTIFDGGSFEVTDPPMLSVEGGDF